MNELAIIWAATVHALSMSAPLVIIAAGVLALVRGDRWVRVVLGGGEG